MFAALIGNINNILELLDANAGMWYSAGCSCTTVLPLWWYSVVCPWTTVLQLCGDTVRCVPELLYCNCCDTIWCVSKLLYRQGWIDSLKNIYYVYWMLFCFFQLVFKKDSQICSILWNIEEYQLNCVFRCMPIFGRYDIYMNWCRVS